MRIFFLAFSLTSSPKKLSLDDFINLTTEMLNAVTSKLIGLPRYNASIHASLPFQIVISLAHRQKINWTQISATLWLSMLTLFHLLSCSIYKAHPASTAATLNNTLFDQFEGHFSWTKVSWKISNYRDVIQSLLRYIPITKFRIDILLFTFLYISPIFIF